MLQVELAIPTKYHRLMDITWLNNEVVHNYSSNILKHGLLIKVWLFY